MYILAVVTPAAEINALCLGLTLHYDVMLFVDCTIDGIVCVCGCVCVCAGMYPGLREGGVRCDRQLGTQAR